MSEFPRAIKGDIFTLLAIKSQGLVFRSICVEMGSGRKGIPVQNTEIVPVGLRFGERHGGAQFQYPTRMHSSVESKGKEVCRGHG